MNKKSAPGASTPEAEQCKHPNHHERIIAPIFYHFEGASVKEEPRNESPKATQTPERKLVYTNAPGRGVCQHH
ncbi:MAG: hypothetical protein AAGU75_17285, partial [Bacillota bacterium]